MTIVIHTCSSWKSFTLKTFSINRFFTQNAIMGYDKHYLYTQLWIVEENQWSFHSLLWSLVIQGLARYKSESFLTRVEWLVIVDNEDISASIFQFACDVHHGVTVVEEHQTSAIGDAFWQLLHHLALQVRLKLHLVRSGEAIIGMKA